MKDIEARHRNSHREKFREKWRRNEQVRDQEKRRAVKKKWKLKNPDKVKAKGDRWNAANPDRKRAHGKKWRNANPDKIAEKNKTYKILNAAKLKPANDARVKQWRKANPEGVTKLSNARRARKNNAPGSHTTKEILDLLERQQFNCAACGTDISKKRHLDHIVALSRGGSNFIINLQWLCPSCNCSKHDKDPVEWVRENGRLL